MSAAEFVYSYLKSGKRLGIITAYRRERTREQNRLANKMLGKLLWLKGYNVPKHVSSVWKSPHGEVVMERPYLVPGAKKSDLDELGKRFNQQSYIIIDGGIGYEFNVGESVPAQVFDKWKILSEEEAENREKYPAYTEIKHRKFTLIPAEQPEKYRYPTSSIRALSRKLLAVANHLTENELNWR